MNIWLVLAFALLFVFLFVWPRLSMTPVDTAREAFRNGAKLVDVRTPAEFRGGSAPGAVNIPLGEVANGIKAKGWPKDTPVLLFCRSGTRSAAAKRQLQGAGYQTVLNVGTVHRANQVAR